MTSPSRLLNNLAEAETERADAQRAFNANPSSSPAFNRLMRAHGHVARSRLAIRNAIPDRHPEPQPCP